MSDGIYGRHRGLRQRRLVRSVVMTVLVAVAVITLGLITGGGRSSTEGAQHDAAVPEVVPPPTAGPLDVPGGEPDASAPTSPAAATTPASTPAAGQPVRTAPPAFVPISVQAEDPGNTLFGGAGVVDCSTCDGGARVRYITGVNRVVVRANANVAGTRTVTVVYETDGPRMLKVSINDGPPYVVTIDGTSWEAPRRLTFTATIPAGAVNVALFNEQSAAPDIDKITIS
ncbi:hypothetical protein [Dactylosporangium sp. CA-092794]|uniref:hypothetical protein n=1 Tax=Dactylosporangium sp. CA-092794 TaxID=3239929 RepID=UPI003D91651A